MSAYRFRECPRCHYTGPGGAFRPAKLGRAGWKASGTMRRICPRCHHIAMTKDFAIVEKAARS